MKITRIATLALRALLAVSFTSPAMAQPGDRSGGLCERDRWGNARLNQNTVRMLRLNQSMDQRLAATAKVAGKRGFKLGYKTQISVDRDISDREMDVVTLSQRSGPVLPRCWKGPASREVTRTRRRILFPSKKLAIERELAVRQNDTTLTIKHVDTMDGHVRQIFLDAPGMKGEVDHLTAAEVLRQIGRPHHQRTYLTGKLHRRLLRERGEK
jgi:hypothetical protein